MAKKSDKSGPRRISASEASRSFSSLLDQVESGRRFVIHRHGREVCVMAPPEVQGRPATECLEILRSRPDVRLDDRFGEDLLEIIRSEAVETGTPWGS